MAQSGSQPPSSSTPPLQVRCSSHFIPWLYEQQISLALTTYQTNRLFLLGVKPDGRLSTFERLFDRAMGLAATPERLYMSSRYQLWQFDNVLNPGEAYNGYDRLYIPRTGWTTGELDVHDIAVDKAGRVLFINTLYSCLATLDERHSFTPLWQPPFISRLAPEDRCHLNGLALRDGEARYVTMVSRSDVTGGWRDRRQEGGAVYDIQSNEQIASGLSMPHSPRYYRDRLWLLNSGRGEFGYIDPRSGRFEAVAFCPGYLRGLAFHDNLAIVGLSKPRHNQTFTGLPLDERLLAKEAEPRCGLMVIDLDSGNIVHWLELEGVVAELYDVQVLQGVRRPMALGFKTDEIRRIITFPQPQGVTLHTLVPVAKEKQAPPAAPPGTAPTYALQLLPGLTRAALETQYDRMLFPPISLRASTRPLHEPFLGLSASYQGETIGLLVADVDPNHTAEILSLWVDPLHRKKGVATALMVRAQEALTRAGSRAVEGIYRTSWADCAAVERLLQKQEWTAPETRMLLYKLDVRLEQSPLFFQLSVPSPFMLFPWGELTPAERDTLMEEADAPWRVSGLNPFQLEQQMEPLNSLGLRRDGEIAGWIITHRVATDTIQYASVYLRERYQRPGVGLALMVESARRQHAQGIPYAIFMVTAENQSINRFVKSKFKEVMVSSAEVRASRKSLIAPL